jgi:hypothetical protein
MSHKNSLFSSGTDYPFFSLHTTHSQHPTPSVTRSRLLKGEGTDLPALEDFIVSSNGKVLLSANFDSASEQSVIVVETLNNGSDFRLTQLQIRDVTTKGSGGGRTSKPLDIAHVLSPALE